MLNAEEGMQEKDCFRARQGLLGLTTHQTAVILPYTFRQKVQLVDYAAEMTLA